MLLVNIHVLVSNATLIVSSCASRLCDKEYALCVVAHRST